MPNLRGAAFRIGVFALIACEAGNAAYAASEDPVRRPVARLPEESSLRVRKGIVGGIISPILEREVRAGYDRNHKRFCVVVEDGHSRARLALHEPTTYKIAELSRSEFVALMDGVLARKLAALPIESPVAVEDIYGMNTGLEMHYGSVDWMNGAPGGCVQNSSSVQPSETELKEFELIISWIGDTVDRLQYRSVSEAEAESAAPAIESGSIAVMRVALAGAAEQEFSDALDLNRAFIQFVGAGVATVHFPWRTTQTIWCWPPPKRVLEAFSLQVDALTLRIVGTKGRRPDTWELDAQRREAFLKAHPELESTLKDLLRAGWIRPGMSREMVLAAWGEPVWADERGAQYLREGRDVRLSYSNGILERFN